MGGVEIEVCVELVVVVQGSLYQVQLGCIQFLEFEFCELCKVGFKVCSVQVDGLLVQYGVVYGVQFD